MKLVFIALSLALSGIVSIRFAVKFIVGIIALALAGCAGVQTAVTGLRAAEDANIQGWTLNACATPLSAAIRHPEIVPTLRALCLPAGDGSNPAILLQ